MNPSTTICKIIGRKKYDTKTATLLAGDNYWDGHNFERYGRNTFLYRTTRGAYFVLTLTQWQDEQHTLTPISQDKAIDLYEKSLTEHYVDYSIAFPDIDIEEA